MSLSEPNHSSVGPRLSIMNFGSSTESLQTRFLPDPSGPCLGTSDLNFAINAPASYCPPTNGALATLFFDRDDCVRALPSDCYQVKCAHHLDAEAFFDWAEQGIRLLTHPLMHVGLIGTDLMDLMRVLRAIPSRQLHLAILPYDIPTALHREQLQRFRFRNLFASLFAGPELSLETYAELGCALEQINPNMQEMFLTANCYSGPPIVLLLGERDLSGDSDACTRHISSL